MGTLSNRSIISWILAGVVLTALVSTPCFAQTNEPNETQIGMRGIFLTLTKAYNQSLDSAGFEDPANHQVILGALQALAQNAKEFQLHGGGLDSSFEYLRRSLADDAMDALNRFQSGQYMGARFVLSKITENCVTCHTKLPRAKQFDLGAQFLNNPEIQKLHPADRVNIEIATRQFNAAVNTYETMFQDKNTRIEDLALIGAFEGYTRICLGVLRDTSRPVEHLTMLSQRPDVPSTLKRHIARWVASLQRLKLHELEGHELEAARKLIAEGESHRKNPSDRSEMVNFVAASTLLHRFLDSKPGSSADVAEAFYLLGISESYISRSYWISETSYLLEQCIRTAPKSEVARKAYAFLEDYTLSGQAATLAREVPADLMSNLEELRALMEE